MSEIAVRSDYPATTALTNEQLNYIARTEFVPPGLRGNLPAILACVATGRALGIDDMTAIRSIHIIDGKATFSAELMVQLVRRRGHSIVGDVTEGSATVKGTRADNGDTMTSMWTLAMAERAGLVNKQNWKKYPEAMLWARAASQLCRMLFADCFAGATYTTEELGAEDTDSFGAAVVEDDRLFPPVDQPLPGALAEPEGESGVHPPVVSGSASVDRSTLTAPQAKKLNVLVGKLRPTHISTVHLWRAVGRDPVPSEDGEVHWSPLRDSLSRDEASELIERLVALEEKVAPTFEIPEAAR